MQQNQTFFHNQGIDIIKRSIWKGNFDVSQPCVNSVPLHLFTPNKIFFFNLMHPEHLKFRCWDVVFILIAMWRHTRLLWLCCWCPDENRALHLLGFTSDNSDVNDISSGQNNNIDVSMMCFYCIHCLLT